LKKIYQTSYKTIALKFSRTINKCTYWISND